ncbi:hypothetical protein [Clostridium cibarium]|uniref:Uncharacterized protein n=1 Tax=Clostridium cibarium TaxID=2762247 RepID=A0ABR8PNK8_9CLOT|nr:hypothetical protein [Clostridium cibarium]MBD7909727.1 hypothetical protein [Clostridium cibarium]
MDNLSRLKLELSNKEYYTNEEYSVFLGENNLVPSDTYSKATNEINLLNTVIAILETLANDTDMMRKIDSKDVMTIDQASKYLESRISNINAKIIDIQESKNQSTGNINPIFFTR